MSRSQLRVLIYPNPKNNPLEPQNTKKNFKIARNYLTYIWVQNSTLVWVFGLQYLTVMKRNPLAEPVNLLESQ